MGHFKAKRRGVNKKKQIIIIFLLITSIVFLIILFKGKLAINQKKMQHLVFAYLQMEGKTKKDSKVEIKTLKEESYPLVYIYNTHQSEKYAYHKINDFNIDYDVLFASQILKNYLENHGIHSIVETTSMNNLLKDNNLNYSQSYDASRILLENSIINYPSLKYFVDLHRDSSSYETTTCIINDQKYAKILFVIGLENDNYEKNKDLSIKLNERLKRINECLSRGIMEKKGDGVNGVYNQDFNKNTFLIEVGGQYNTIEEVDNILNIFASILAEYIKESS